MALGLGVFARRLAAQNPADTSAADRLRWPEAVQPRAVVQAGDDAEVIKGIERRLKCTCGCNLDIFTCRTTDFTCTYSPALHREVMALHEEGKSPDEIVNAFVLKYGEEVLMAPPAEGFNLAGYLVPGFAMLLGATVLAWVLVRRGRTPAKAPPEAPAARASAAPPATAAPGRPTAEELHRLEAALRDVAD